MAKIILALLLALAAAGARFTGRRDDRTQREGAPVNTREQQGTDAGRRDAPRPEPDHVELEGEAPQPQPERHEAKDGDPDLGDLTRADMVAIAKRTVKESLDDGITDLAAALAYYSFLALPAILLVAVSAFSLIAGREAINDLIAKFATVMPAESTQLIGDSLRRLDGNAGTTIPMLVLGLLFALWTATGAMTAFMRALNRAYEVKETRKFVKQRVTAMKMLVVMFVAFVLVFGLLVLGPHVSSWVGSAVGAEGVVDAIWWAAQWPVLLVGLFAAFAIVLYLGPNVDHPKFQFLTPGAVVAAAVWIIVSGLFALYTSMFGSYDKTWGSLSAVIVMLTWLWLSSLALLLGAEINAEVERSRQLRQGQPAERDLQTQPAG